jgi:hypothetical protein
MKSILPENLKGPWKFSDKPDMEDAFQINHVSGILDSLRPVGITLFPLGLILRIVYIASAIWGNDDFSLVSTSFSVARLGVNIWMLYTFTNQSSWSEDRKMKIGHVLIWIIRFFFLAVLAQEAGLQQDHTSIMSVITILFFFTVLEGIVTPTFEEHVFNVFMVFAFSSGKLLHCILIEKSTSYSTQWSAWKQRAIVLSVSLAVNHLLHSDRRRLWLASPRLLSRSNDADAEPSNKPSTGDRNDPSDAIAIAEGWSPLSLAGTGGFICAATYTPCPE